MLDAFGPPKDGGVLTQIYMTSSNTVFLFVAISVAYGMVSSGGVGGVGLRRGAPFLHVQQSSHLTLPWRCVSTQTHRVRAQWARLHDSH